MPNKSCFARNIACMSLISLGAAASPIAILSALPQEQRGLIALLQQPQKITHASRDFWLGNLHGQPVGLARKEFTLLSLLARQPGRLVTQSQLLRDMWGPTHQEDAHYLRVLVGKLRAKLGDDAAAPLYIATEPGVGLRFLGRDKPPAQGEQ